MCLISMNGWITTGQKKNTKSSCASFHFTGNEEIQLDDALTGKTYNTTYTKNKTVVLPKYRFDKPDC